MTPAELDALERRLHVRIHAESATVLEFSTKDVDLKDAADAIDALRADLAAKDATIAENGRLLGVWQQKLERAEADNAALRALLWRWYDDEGYVHDATLYADTALALGENDEQIR